MNVTVVYYLDVISSWCFWAEETWAELRERYAGKPVEFVWKIALMDASGMPQSEAQVEWFYRRSGMMVRSPFMLKTGWYEAGLTEYLAPNCVAEAAKDFGINDDRARLALARATVLEGRKVSGWELAADIAAGATGLDPADLLAKARSLEIESRVRAATAEFHQIQATQRPSFVLKSNIGDHALFSGLIKVAPIAATIDAMLEDAAAYAAHAAHFGSVPP